MVTVRGFRRVLTAQEAVPAGQGEDPYLIKLLKYIPAEAISAYPIGMAAADNVAEASRVAAYVVWFVFLLVGTPIWTFITTTKPGQQPKWLQIGFAPVAFTLWFLNIGDDHVKKVWQEIFHKGPLDPGWAALLLIMVTIVATMIEQFMPSGKPAGGA